MRLDVRDRWRDIRGSLWFVPAVEVVLAIAGSTLTLWLDAAHADWLSERLPVIFGGTAEGARTLLSAIAGSVISVVAVIFSVTMIALQQASSQYTPRVLRTFMQDRGNQIVLGTYIATFTYALLVLRQVRSETDSVARFTPSLSIFVTIVLSLVALALLVYFIHHTARSLQVSFVIRAIRSELDTALEQTFEHRGHADAKPSYEDAVGSTQHRRRGEECVVRAERDGYLRTIDDDSLVREAGEENALLFVPVRVGEYVLRGSVLARFWTSGGASEGRRERIGDCFMIHQERRTSDDPLFGIRQLADIGLKALSPGINDPTTAEDAIDALGSVVAFLLDRATPPALLYVDNGGCLLRRVRTFDEYVEECFSQIRRAARTQPHVLEHMLDLLAQLAERAPSPERVAPLERQMSLILEAARTNEAPPADREALLARGSAALDAIVAAARRPRET